MKFTLKKSLIIAALENNELIHKVFFWADNTKTKPYDTPIGKCKVCAVGAVIRDCILNKKATQVDGSGLAHGLIKGVSIFHDKNQYLSEKDYLSALSTFFECLDRDLRISKSEVKLRTIEFVRKNFPTQFSVKIHDQYKGKTR
jgi:hypothetical protein